MSQVMKSLNEEMQVLAGKKVKAYLESDLALDVERMKKGQEGRQYLWLLRDAGTVMARLDWLAYLNAPDFVEVSYYHPDDILAAYEITVTQIKGDELSGTIRKISNYSRYYEQMMTNAKVSTQAKIGVFLNNGELIEIEKPMNEKGFNYYRLLEDLRLKDEEVSKVCYLDFSLA